MPDNLNIKENNIFFQRAGRENIWNKQKGARRITQYLLSLRYFTMGEKNNVIERAVRNKTVNLIHVSKNKREFLRTRYEDMYNLQDKSSRNQSESFGKEKKGKLGMKLESEGRNMQKIWVSRIACCSVD